MRNAAPLVLPTKMVAFAYLLHTSIQFDKHCQSLIQLMSIELELSGHDGCREKDAAALIRTIVSVVAHCHSLGVIHR